MPVREVVDEVGTKGLEATFEVDVPAEVLLDALWDVTQFPRLFPDVKHTRVLRRAEDELDVEHEIDAVLRRVRYVLRRTRDRARGRISWMELSGDLRRVRGGWQVTPTEKGCHVVYTAFVDVGRFVPTSVVRDLAMRKIDEMIARVSRVARELHDTTTKRD